MMQPSAYQDNMSSEHNGAAILSLICAVVWPLSFLIPAVFNVVTGGPKLPAPIIPNAVSFLLESGFALLPIIGIVAGSIGLYRAMKRPALKSTRWQALVGLLLGCLWIIGIFVLSDLGSAFIYWISRQTR